MHGQNSTHNDDFVPDNLNFGFSEVLKSDDAG